MSQTRARRMYRRWVQYGAQCNKIGGIPGNRVPKATARAALSLFLQKKKPHPAWPVVILHGWPG